MLACNMSGTEKLIPLIVGKFKNIRSFKNFSKYFFCRYTHNKNTWMTSAVFNMWLFDINQKFKKERRKILLVLDNCPAHKISVETSHIELIFLSKNTTSKLQPLDAGIIRSFKAKFYGYQLSSVVDKISSGIQMEKIFSGISLIDGIVYSRFAWDDVTDKTIQNCF
ncbi:Tigger transposable element-derived protein 6 [Dictyocoela muelleri]|nr:Tigger transposable element-derived protein 6 [Dictyocoela muelleri]